MNEPRPLGIFADLLKWKLASRLVVGLVTVIAFAISIVAIRLSLYFLEGIFTALERSEGAERAERLESELRFIAESGILSWLLMLLIGPPILAGLHLLWAMFTRRARAVDGR